MPDPITGSPIQFPTITIGGATYSLRFSLLAELVADQLGLDTPNFFSDLQTKNTGKVTAFTRMFAAMVAHNFVAIKQTPPTPEQWMETLDALPDGQGAAKFREICDAVGQCLLAKIQASAAAMKLREPAPAQGLQPN